MAIDASVEPTIVTFADNEVDYLYTESASVAPAWNGPFPTGDDYHLYWDIDKTTGARTFDYTTVAPLFGDTRPTTPTIDQHFFDTVANKMLVWNGSTWVERLRVFAGVLTNGTTLSVNSAGSQVGITEETTAGHILFDQNDVALRHGDFLLTTVTAVYATDNKLNYYKLEAKENRAEAVTHVPQFYAVSWQGPNRIGLASSANPTRGAAFALALEEMNVGDVKRYVTDGIVTNNNWNFTADGGTALFVGKNGEVTTDVPQQFSLQRVGQIINATTIFLDFGEFFLLDTIAVTPTPTISLTPSVTPTLTPAATATPTPTVTVTPTITASVTPAVTATATPTPTVTVSNTPGVTPTATVTPTVTPSISVTPSITPTQTAAVTPTATVTPTVTPSGTVPGATPCPTPTPIPAFSTGYTAGGFQAPSSRIDVIQSYPFAAPFGSSTDLGDLTANRHTGAGASSSTDGYNIAGTDLIMPSPQTQEIESFPFSTPFTTATVVGSLNDFTGSTSGNSSPTDGYANAGALPVGSSDAVQRFPFSSPFTLTTVLGDLTTGRAGDTANASSGDEGYIAGGLRFPSPNQFLTTVQKFPFAVPFVTTEDVGDLNTGVYRAAGIQSNIDGYSARW